MAGLFEKDLHDMSCRTGIPSQGEGGMTRHADGGIAFWNLIQTSD